MEQHTQQHEPPAGPRVIVVDDLQPVRHFLIFLLERNAPELVMAGEADSVDGAVALIRAARPDVVLIDTDIIGGTGIDVFAKLPEARLAWVFLCASAEEADMCGRIPGARVLMKPVELDALLEAVRG